MADNKIQPDPIARLYNNIKNEYDLPDFNTFKADMSDSNKAKRLHATLVTDGYEVPKYDVFSVDMGLKKKAGNSASLGMLSPSPKESNFLQQGQKMASGEVFKDISASVPKSVAQPIVKTTLKDAALKDKENNNSYIAALYNSAVSGIETLVGSAARLNQKFDSSPVAMIQESVDKAASSVTGVNYEALREKEVTDRIKGLVGKARSSASSREYEQGLAKGFDITDGIGLDDIKGIGVALPRLLVDIGLGVSTGGSSFAIQGYDNALSTIDDIPEGKYMSETTRTAFGFGGAIVSGVLEKIGLNSILKSGTATKYVTAKILKEAAEELAKKGVKVTAEQFEKAVTNKATQMLTKTALKNTVKAGVRAGKGEAITEASQEGAFDLMKLAANKLEGKEIFDEDDMKKTAASRYLNAAAMGGIFGGGLSLIGSRAKNVQGHIENEVKNAKTQEDIDNLVNEINQGVEDGVISQNDAELFKSIVDENISKPSSLDIVNEKDVKLSDIDSQIASLNKEDRLYNDNLNKLNKEKNEIISFYDNISNKTQEDEEIPFDDGKDIPSELIVDVESIVPQEIESKKAEIESRREAELNDLPNRGVASKGGVIITSKEFDEIKNKYDAELAELESGNLNPRLREDDVTQEVPEARSTVEGNDFLNDLKNLSKSLGEPKGNKIQINTTEDIKSQKANIEGERQAELENLKKGIPAMITKKLELGLKQYGFTDAQINKMTPIVANETFVNAKYDAKLNSLEGGKQKAKPTEVKSVEQLREQEQAELDSKIPNAEQYRVDGKVDKTKLTNEEDIKAFDEVYNKYDKLISPLLEKPAEAKEEKTFAQKDLNRAEAKRIHGRVSEMDPPSDAEQIALRYLSDGGKVSQDAINEVSGSTKRASLNTGRRELKTAEVKARDYAEGKESLDDLAHRLWENSGQEISERDIKDALMSEIGNNNTRLDASKAYLERYSPEYQQEQYYNRLAGERQEEFLKEQDELERQLRKPLDEQIEGEASEEYINNLIKQYEAEFERENKQLEPKSKGETAKEVSGRDGGKEVKEKSIEQAYKDLTRNEKRQIINSKFDELVKELKIEKICPT